MSLLVQRAKRQQVERELRGSEQELRGSQARLRVSYDRIRHLSRRLLGEQEAERARIARELHDDINQQLTVLSIELDRLRADQLPIHSAERLSRALERTQDVSTTVRDLSHRLHPSRLLHPEDHHVGEQRAGATARAQGDRRVGDLIGRAPVAVGDTE